MPSGSKFQELGSGGVEQHWSGRALSAWHVDERDATNHLSTRNLAPPVSSSLVSQRRSASGG
jgi:hypothetical protein